MVGIVRVEVVGDVVTVVLETSRAMAGHVEATLGHPPAACATHGTARFELSGPDALVAGARAAGCPGAGEAALVALDSQPVAPGDAWVDVDGAGVRVRDGERVVLLHTDDPYTPLRPGAAGSVTRVWINATSVVVDVAWESGSRLGLIPEAGDRWRTKEDV